MPGAQPKSGCIRVEVRATHGSAPREAGAFMLVWESGQSGTIGGGALEWQALLRARQMLAGGVARDVQRVALGPELGQCCGGRVELGFERITPGRRASVPCPQAPLARALAADLRGWRGPAMPLWLYGAGHVGRALVRALPFAPQWVDVAEARFPDWAQNRVIKANPAAAVALAPDDALHFVMTHSHSIDLEICHQVLRRPFGHLGLIGSASKKARFLKRLRALGHGAQTLKRLQCPIGDKRLGKAPEAIALGVAHWLWQRQYGNTTIKGRG